MPAGTRAQLAGGLMRQVFDTKPHRIGW